MTTWKRMSTGWYFSPDGFSIRGEAGVSAGFRADGTERWTYTVWHIWDINRNEFVGGTSDDGQPLVTYPTLKAAKAAGIPLFNLKG